VNSVAISSDSTRIVSGGADKTVKVWDSRSGKEILTLLGHQSAVISVATSSDGTCIVSAGRGDRTVNVWDGRSGEPLHSPMGHKSAVSSVAISSDGSRIVSGSYDKTVKVWDFRSGTDLLTLKGHTHWVGSVAISSDGGRILSGSYDGTVKVWDARSGKDLLTLRGHISQVSTVAISSAGTYIVGGNGWGTWPPRVMVWDCRNGKDLLFLKGNNGPVSRVAVSSDGERIFAQEDSGKILAWNSATGQLLPDPPDAMPPGGQEASTADGTLRVRIENGNLRVYRADLEQERQQREARNRDLLEGLARFDPDWHQEQLKEALGAKDDFAAACHLYALARGCARSVPLADQPESGEKQAARAVEWLRQAVARGYQDVAQLKRDPDLDALRGRDDFKKVLAEVEAAARPKKKTKVP
jgi:hypothetical protein